MNDEQGPLTEREAAAYLRVAARTLKQWRQQGTGPTYARLSERKIIYQRADLDAFIGDRRVVVAT